MIYISCAGKSKIIHCFLRNSPANLFSTDFSWTTIEITKGKKVSIWDLSGQVLPEYKTKFCQLSDGKDLYVFEVKIFVMLKHCNQNYFKKIHLKILKPRSQKLIVFFL